MSSKLSIILSTMGSEHLENIAKTFLLSRLPIEIIIIIDNPKIEAEKILSNELLHDDRVKIVVNEKNLGITKSLNKGINLASGDIIVRADDDDIPSNERLDEISNFLIQNPGVDIVYSFAEGYDVASQKKWIISGPDDDAKIKQNLLLKNFMVHSSIAFRYNKFKQIGFYDETFRYAQDYDLYLRAIDAGFVFGCIPKVLVKRLYHKDSITVSKRRKQILHSMSARLLYTARSTGNPSPWPIIFRYVKLLIIPNWARNLRRKIGLGR